MVELTIVAGTLARFSNIQNVSFELSIDSSLNGWKFLPLSSTLVPPWSGPRSGTSSVIAGQE